MRYSIDTSLSRAAYMQLYDQLRRDIVAGLLAHGTKLPSKRLMAEETGVSVITVEHTYAILADEGYIEPRERRGYFVIYREKEMVSGAENSESVSFQPRHTHSAAMEFPFSVLAKTMRRVLTECGEDILIKSPNHGCPELRAAIAAYLARSRGLLVSPEQIIIGSGAEYLYSLIVPLLGRDRVFGLEDPSYDKIRRVYETCGVTCDLLQLGPNGILSEALLNTPATVLHVTPFNSFPSGVSADASKRAEYLRWADRRDGYIIEDNYDSELTVSRKQEDPLFSLGNTGRVIYLNTFSKTVAPSVRVGYMVLPQSLLPVFTQRLGFYSCTVPVFEQYVLAHLLADGDFERHVNRVRRARRKTSGHIKNY